MIKLTLYFGNPAYLSVRLNQLVIKKPLNESAKEGSTDELDRNHAEELVKTVPIEDLGIVVLDHQRITITQGALQELLDNNVAVLTCNSSHLPVGLMLPLCGNTIQNERFRAQIDASLPLKKQLWQQTIEHKIFNQAVMLKYATGHDHGNMLSWANCVRSGDPDNLEARAAAYYWKNIFPDNPLFIRGRDDDRPNNLFNYGYALLRAIVARSLVASGLLPTLGIHHHNRYNAYCLADDIMEPYRPYVDRIVYDMVSQDADMELTTEKKAKLLSLPVVEVKINEKRSPLMVAVSTTTSSLVKCFTGESRKIIYPEMD